MPLQLLFSPCTQTKSIVNSHSRWDKGNTSISLQTQQLHAALSKNNATVIRLGNMFSLKKQNNDSSVILKTL